MCMGAGGWEGKMNRHKPLVEILSLGILLLQPVPYVTWLMVSGQVITFK